MFVQVQLGFVSFAQLVGQTKAMILGIEAQMKTFNYLFGMLLGEVILRNTDNLSRTLQHQHLSATEGQNVASLTVKTSERLEQTRLFGAKLHLLDHNIMYLNQNSLDRGRPLIDMK